MNEWLSRWRLILRRKLTLTVRTLAILVISIVVSGFLMGSFGSGQDDLFLKTKQWIEIFGKVYTEVAMNYVDEVDPEQVMHAGIDGMLKTLDPYTVYLGEKESDEMELVTTGKYAGVGITIGVRDGYITVINPIEGYSAAKQGIQSGDRIVEIDGKNARLMKPEDVRLLSRGAPGTTVRMKIERDGEPKPIEFVLVREEIPVRNVTFTGYVTEGVGYIRLERFSRTAGEDVRIALKELREQGSLKALVLDLRDNPGGLLDMAVDVVSKFVPESTLVVSTKGRRSDSERKYFSYETPALADAPLAVLVDRGSASASEIVAGAIQDLDRGIIVGTRSFGKGLVQTITRISENGSLKITSGKYYTPSGRSIQEIDYFHSGKEGTVTVKPDSLRKEYRTVHNRKVTDGRGIVPDSIVNDEVPSKLLDELTRKAMFFKYANYLATQKTVVGDSFEVTADILKDFGRFLKDKEFQYEEDSEVKIKELRETAEKERFGKSFYEGIGQIEKVILAEKERAFERYGREVKYGLKLEIIRRLKGERAAIAASLQEDKQLQVAAGLVRNKTLYRSMLAGDRR